MDTSMMIMRFVTQYLLPAGVTGGVFALAVWALGPLFARAGAKLRKAALAATLALFLLPLPMLASAGFAALPGLAAVSGADADASVSYVANVKNTTAPTAPSAPRDLPEESPTALPGPSPASEAAGADVAKSAGTDTGMLSTINLKSISAAVAEALPYLATVYLAVALLLTVVFAARCLLFGRALRRESKTDCGGPVRRLYLAECESLGIKRPPALYANENLSTPLLAGLFRQAIFLPAGYGGEDGENAGTRFALRHELIHAKHRDILFKYLSLFVCALHWLNPCAWLLKRQLGDAMEHLCDEATTRGMPLPQRKQYAHVLVNCAGRQSAFAAIGFVSPGKNMKRRLVHLLAPKKRSLLATASASVLLCAAVAACLLAGCGTAETAGNALPLEKPSASPAAASVSSSPSTPPSSSSSASASSATAVNGEDESAYSSAQPGDYIDTRAYPLTFTIDDGMVLGGEIDGKTLQFFAPLAGPELTVDKGMQDGHRGVDFAADIGTPVLAIADGTVETATYHYSWGNMVLLNHGGGLQTLYAHMDTLFVKGGDTVTGGQQLGTTGMTGNVTRPGLHVEVWESGGLFNPLNYIPGAPSDYEYVSYSAGVDTSNFPPETGGFVSPLDLPPGEEPFYIRDKGNNHRGLDFTAEEGDSIVAMAAGTVTTADYDENFGNHVRIDHGNGYETLYAHCKDLYVTEGQTVLPGEAIATVGSTGMASGPHLHLEMTDETGELVDPKPFVVAYYDYLKIPIVLPDLTGMSRQDAIKTVLALGLRPYAQAEVVETGETNTIIRQEPAAGSMVKNRPDTVVTLYTGVKRNDYTSTSQSGAA